MNENDTDTKPAEAGITQSISTANVHRHNNDTKIIEFMQDLKEAIQSGEFQSYGETTEKHQDDSRDQSSDPNISSLINVNNLSNQTFNYIINWLKQQQLQQTDENKSTSGQRKSDPDTEQTASQAQDLEADTQMLRNQVRQAESEKDKLIAKFKELQEENSDLKTKLLNLKSSISFSEVNSVYESKTVSESKSADQLLTEKDYEIQRLNQIIAELVKSNEEKEKRCDDLTKQVLRFKRIQDIVLNAQTNSGFKNKIDLDFDTNSDSNSLPSINGDEPPSQILTAKIKTSQNKSTSSTPHSQPITSPKQYQNPLALASNINQACSLISSCSLSSSLSTSSTASSTSSNSSSQNANNLLAPLATISELNNSTSEHQHSRKSHAVEHYNTLPTSLNSMNDSKRSLNETEMDVGKYRSLNKLSSSNNSSNTMVNESNNISTSEIEESGDQSANKKQTNFSQNLEVFKINKKSKKAGSVTSLNNDIIKKACQQAEKNDKYLSTCSVNRPKAQKKQNSVPPQHKTATNSPTHNNNSIKNFFGKLIRTSLVNINESGFGTMDKKKGPRKQESFDDALNNRNGNNNNNAFKRGGVRATANARLQNNTYSLSNSCVAASERQYLDTDVDTLTFAKWTSDQVYDWLYKNGFDGYFPYNSEGYIGHRWIKNGMHLLQASSADYEKELGIKNPMHRKRLTLMLQSMYNVTNLTQLEMNYTNCIDQLWVTKWLDDIGLPQYKDVFAESKIDGMMLNHLTNEDLQSMNIQSELHYLSIKRAIHVLRLKEFNPHCLRRRPSGDELLDKSEVILWTNHRIMEWLRSIDLSEYAPNLRGSGVHGALMVLEGRFNSTVLADILAIPASKTLLRRHLNTLFIDLIGPQMYQLKYDTEAQANYQPLNATTKLKFNKRGLGVSLFSHKRSRSQDREFLTAPVLKFGEEYKPYDTFCNNLSGPVNAMIASFREETSAFDKELSMTRNVRMVSKERTFN